MNNQNEMSDEQLALSYINGDNRAFDELLRRNQSKLFSYILFIVQDRDKAEDFFQETFVRVITKLHAGKYTTSGKFSAWLMRVAHNIIMDDYRDQKGDQLVEFGENNDLTTIHPKHILDSNIENQFVNDQVMADVKKMVNLLPTCQREVVYMRYYQQLSFKEIAQATNVSINTALGRMRYALLNLRRMAKEHSMALTLE
ncbi:MAG: sigma-70 family RNA polymerase sigma factor [Prevotella sp.]|nr:sigma-70 family RNA polymerase sigma factor [Prevotella sp.]